HIPRGSICCPPGHVPWSGVISAGERRVVDVASHRAMVSENRSKLLTEKTQSHDGSRPVCLAQPACGVKVVETARVIHRHQATPKSRSERLASSGWQGIAQRSSPQRSTVTKALGESTSSQPGRGDG